MADTFTIVRSLTADEVAAGAKRTTGVTATVPTFKAVDPDHTEFVVDVRVGTAKNWYLIKDCLVSSLALGTITDMGIPVLIEKNSAGRYTVIGRSQVALPDVYSSTASWADLGLLFLSGLHQDGAVWRDGFGHEMTDPTTDHGESIEYGFGQDWIDLDSEDFIWGVTPLGATKTTGGKG